MSHKRKKSLQDRLESLDGNERAKLYKRARQLRKMSRQSPRRSRRRKWDLEEEHESLRPTRQRCRSLEDFVDDLLEEETLREAPDPVTAEPGGSLAAGTVVGLGPGRARVLTAAGDDLECRLAPELAFGQKSEIAVGDDVELRVREDDSVVTSVQPRRTVLSRPDPLLGAALERVMVSNIDIVVVVASLREPPLRLGLIDRFLVAIQKGGARPLICLNKIDLVKVQEHVRQRARLEPFQQLGIPVLGCSAARGEGLEELRAALRGITCAFVGHSGVGKSSLLNALEPGLAIRTRAVTAHAGKGRHTTTASCLHRLPGDTRVIDTPGIRAFGLTLTPVELAAYFEEFELFRPDCRFRDCTHSHEPSCGVRRAVKEGKISLHRWQSYQRLRSDGGGEA